MGPERDLSDEVVLDIDQRLVLGEQVAEIAAFHGLPPEIVVDIARGSLYGHLTCRGQSKINSNDYREL